jgi:cytochrome c peroxidase
VKKNLVAIVLLFLFAFTLKQELVYVPQNWPKPIYDFNTNPISTEKVYLGRVLFYDPLLSKDNTISCASCHSPYSAFTHVDHALSHGIHDSIGTRNSPALMNLAWQKLFMWDGAIHHLDVQALAPISHPAEMGNSIQDVVKVLQTNKKYKQLFSKAFGDTTVTGEKTLKALSQFMLTLISANAKYDQVMQHKTEFSEQEKKGYALFKNNCSSCHVEPLFSSFEFANNGLPVDASLNDLGRIKITQKSEDSLLFKIPSLRNSEYSYPYMHDGRFKKLSEVLNHYTQGIHQSSTLAPQLKKGITLSSPEKVDLIAFLLTLSDKEFIFNKKNGFPKEAFE